jgi:hypothetical protein
MNTKHTPGPWEISLIGEGDELTVDGIESNAVAHAPHRLICEMGHDIDMGQDYAEVIANARLIAAAPELLEACKVVTAFLDNLERALFYDDPLVRIRQRVHAPLRSALNPAIAKAEGREL